MANTHLQSVHILFMIYSHDVSSFMIELILVDMGELRRMANEKSENCC